MVRLALVWLDQHRMAQLQQVEMCDCAPQGESLVLPACLVAGVCGGPKQLPGEPSLPVWLEQRHLFNLRWVRGATGPCRCLPGSAGARH